MRNEKGQFVKGTSGNPAGRARREVETQYLNVMLGAVTEDEWQEVVKAMIKQAKRGNVAAATWLSNYLQGKPQERVDITSNDETLAAPVVYLPKVDDGSAED
jgi:hypothetical protein